MLCRQKILERLEILEDRDRTTFWKLIDDLWEFHKESTTSSAISADVWAEHFKKIMNCSVLSTEGNFDQEMDAVIASNKDHIFNEFKFGIKESEIQSAISALKSGKAAGKDLISNEMIKARASPLRLYPHTEGLDR